MSEPKYKTWRDKADNIGVECLECHRDHWTGKESTTDVLRGKNCDNCVLIKGQTIREKEQAKHREELDNFQRTKADLLEKGESIEGLVVVCAHQPSQPI